MFDSAAIGHRIPTDEFDHEVVGLREGLIDAQLRLRDEKAFALLVLVTGADSSGKGAVIQRLYEWFDPRNLRTNAYEQEDGRSGGRPPMWRYWRDLPPRGDIGVVFGSWYNDCLIHAIRCGIGTAELGARIQEINRFEQMLANESVLLLKFMLHLTAEQHARRTNALKKKSRYASRHVLEEWADIKVHEKAMDAVRRVVRETSTGDAPWYVIPAADENYRDLSFGKTILTGMTQRLEKPSETPVARSAPVLVPSLDGRTILDTLDLSQRLEKPVYKTRLNDAQDELARLTDSKDFQDHSLVLVFEGADAAGKGGTIRRITQALDPRRFRIHAIGAPTDEEKVQPYLWRFWRRIPKHGHTAIFDRSWYGRVLVERVEGFAQPAEWLRAYNEINDFELQLTESGGIVLKFWLAISADEQLARFKAREQTSFKSHKITAEDWRNRERWDDYRHAVNDMIDRTSTRYARWTLIEAEDKRIARVKTAEAIVTALAKALK